MVTGLDLHTVVDLRVSSLLHQKTTRVLLYFTKQCMFRSGDGVTRNLPPLYHTTSTSPVVQPPKTHKVGSGLFCTTRTPYVSNSHRHHILPTLLSILDSYLFVV